MEIVTKAVDELVPYENNPRDNADAVDAVAASIKTFGFNQPIVIDKNNVILAGHTRQLASKQLGLKEVPCIISTLSRAKAKAYRLADNKTAELAEWNAEKLKIELLDLDIDMAQFGFSPTDLETNDLDEVEDDLFDIDEAVSETPMSAPGEIYQLGDHRLMCGDATDPTEVDQLMNGKMADLCVTDPPYNIDYESADGKKIKNDNMADTEFLNFLVAAFGRIKDALKDGGAFYIWHADTEGRAFRNACHEAGLQIRQCLVWNKNTFVLSRQDYHWKHEPCLYGWKDGAAHYFIDDRSQSTVIEDKLPDFKRMKKHELLDALMSIYSDKESTTIINEDKPAISEEHPTMKPVKLIARLIKNSCKPQEIVLDTFGGSGSTMIAAEQLNRACYMMELDPRYVDVIIQRWEEFTGQEAVHVE